MSGSTVVAALIQKECPVYRELSKPAALREVARYCKNCDLVRGSPVSFTKKLPVGLLFGTIFR